MTAVPAAVAPPRVLQILVRALLEGVRREAIADHLIATRALRRADTYIVVVGRAAPAAWRAQAGPAASLRNVTERLDGAGGRQLATLVDGGLAMVVAGNPTGVPAQLRDAAEAALPGAADWLAIGLGGPVERLADAEASLRQARVAADIARRVGGPAPAAWNELGSLAILSAVDPHPWMWAVIAPLFETGDELLKTVETYLDLGARPSVTAEALYVHRTTLHYRLRQVEDRCGIDLRSGDDRLLAHLALRLWRLAGSPR